MDAFEVEHVCPQAITDSWRSAFGDQHGSMLHTWANLLPLTRRMNAEAGQEPYSVKIEEYRNSMFASTREFSDRFTEWTPTAVEVRAEEIASWALTRWPYERVPTTS